MNGGKGKGVRLAAYWGVNFNIEMIYLCGKK